MWIVESRKINFDMFNSILIVLVFHCTIVT